MPLAEISTAGVIIAVNTANEEERPSIFLFRFKAFYRFALSETKSDA